MMRVNTFNKLTWKEDSMMIPRATPVLHHLSTNPSLGQWWSQDQRSQDLELAKEWRFHLFSLMSWVRPLRYRQLRDRRALTLFDNVLLRTRRVLLPYTLYNIMLFWFPTEHHWTALMPFWLSTDDMNLEQWSWIWSRLQNWSRMVSKGGPTQQTIVKCHSG